MLPEVKTQDIIVSDFDKVSEVHPSDLEYLAECLRPSGVGRQEVNLAVLHGKEAFPRGLQASEE